jgi:hypothetical protein
MGNRWKRKCSMYIEKLTCEDLHELKWCVCTSKAEFEPLVVHRLIRKQILNLSMVTNDRMRSELAGTTLTINGCCRDIVFELRIKSMYLDFRWQMMSRTSRTRRALPRRSMIATPRFPGYILLGASLISSVAYLFREACTTSPMRFAICWRFHRRLCGDAFKATLCQLTEARPKATGLS